MQELRRVAPRCNFRYVADHAFCPYGTKSAQQILSRAAAVATFLQHQGAESLVIACNTASVFAEEIRHATQLPVLDVISPTCNEVQRGGYKKVALLATQATLQSGIYQRNLNSFGIETFCFNCSPLVPLVESAAETDTCLTVVADCLNGLPGAEVDAVILACTHFPFIAEEISKFCGGAKVISCALPIAAEFAAGKQPTEQGVVQCLTTGNATAVNAVAQKYGYYFTRTYLKEKL